MVVIPSLLPILLIRIIPLFLIHAIELCIIVLLNQRETIPVLMDSFAYYENDSLIVEAIFNLKYLRVPIEERDLIAKSPCIAWVDGKAANNTFE